MRLSAEKGKMIPEIPGNSREARREYARGVLEGLLEEDGPRDAYWYRVQYLLASDYAHKQLDAWQDGRREEADAAGATAKKLSTDLAVSIETVLAASPRTKEDGFFHSFLEDIEPSALLMWAGVAMLLAEQAPVVEAAEKIPTDRASLRQHLREWIKDGTKPPSHVVRIVEARLKLSARPRYNLACYYGVGAMLAAKAHDKRAEQQYSMYAIVQLDLASPGFSPAMRQWAKHDPCLRQLAQGPYKKAFEQALALVGADSP